MTTNVWPYCRAECDACDWQGPWHLSPVSAGIDADHHDEHHAQVESVLAELDKGMTARGGE